MRKKTQLSLIYALGFLLYIVLDDINRVIAGVLLAILIAIGQFYEKYDLGLRKEAFLYIILLTVILLTGIFLSDLRTPAYLTGNYFTDGLLGSIVIFIFLNYLIYE